MAVQGPVARIVRAAAEEVRLDVIQDMIDSLGTIGRIIFSYRLLYAFMGRFAQLRLKREDKSGADDFDQKNDQNYCTERGQHTRVLSDSTATAEECHQKDGKSDNNQSDGHIVGRVFEQFLVVTDSGHSREAGVKEDNAEDDKHQIEGK